jgi:uncharacterized damage-inducible protein DinB
MNWLSTAANLGDDQVKAKWSWIENPGGETLQVRDALYGLLESEQDAAATGGSMTYASAQMALAQAAFGDVRGLVAGLADELLDAVPAEGEWSIRQTLQHMLEVELSYRTRVEWAVNRRDADPLQRPDSLGPKPEESLLEGGFDLALGRLASARARSDSSLGSIREAQLSRPTTWAGYDVDVAFRLRRFASHVSEHTIQVEKALDALGVRLGEARRIVRRISAMRGLHERRTDPARLAELDRLATERLSRLG